MAHKSLRRRPKQDRSAETLAVIRSAAAQVLITHGYARATTNRIAERAGVSVGSIYQYFDGKDAVLVAVLREYIDQLVAIVRETELPADASLKAQLRALTLAGLQARPDGPSILVTLSRTAADEFRTILDTAKIEVVRYLEQQLSLHGSKVPPAELAERLAVAVDAIEGLFVHSAQRMAPEAFAHEVAELIAPYLLAERDPD